MSDDETPSRYADQPSVQLFDRPPEVMGHIHTSQLDNDTIPEETIEKSPAWLVTFGDVTALMLAFFVMLYSMSQLQSEKWDNIISVLATRDDPQVEGETRPIGERTITRIDLVSAFPTGYLQRILETKLADDPLLKTIRMTGLEDQLVLSLPTDKFFTGNGAVINPEAMPALRRLGVVFSQFGNRLDIKGNTDPNPPAAGSVYPDNWALSLGRGLAVAKALNEAGYPGDFTVLGLADSNYRYIDGDIPEQERFALARRVDIVIVPEARGQ
ncbi:MAG: flagellar motor protein MotB [Alphaproteobacteria bacterium]|nr:flagellar motor protein MotB [Alphaproteobacteria bacterium]